MKLTIVALYSSYLGAYDKPTFQELTGKDVAEQYRRSVLAAPDQAYKALAQDKTVVILGTFDDVSGVIELLDSPMKVLDLASAFPPGFLKKMEALKNA